MKYRREIDGLRALAVVPVILFHAGFDFFNGGFVGVDVFFVISGYLITSIIATEFRKNTFSIISFYERRARRILQALFVVMFFCMVMAWAILLPTDMQEFSRSLVATQLFGSNIMFWMTSGYFDSSADMKPLLHTWSLAIEEQYYLFFPLGLMLFWRRGEKTVTVLLVSVVALSLALAQWASIHKPTAAFYLLPTRSWELLMGSLAAFYSLRNTSRDFNETAHQVLGAIGVFSILFAVFTFDDKTPFPGLYALVPTVGAVLVILFSSSQTWTGKILGSRAMVGIGLISFSLYLWHQPLLAFARHASPHDLEKPMVLALLVLLSVLSFLTWRYVESPFRNRSIVSSSQVFGFSAAGCIFFCVAGLAGSHSGLQTLWELRHPGLINEVEKTAPPIARDCPGLPERQGTMLCKVVGHGSKRVVLWGDSHAEVLARGVLPVDGIEYYLISHTGCPPIIGMKRFDGIGNSSNCSELNIIGNYAKYISSISPDVVIMAGRWLVYINGWRKNGVLQSAHHFLSDQENPRLLETSDERRNLIQKKLLDTVDHLAKTARVVLLMQPPEMPDDEFRQAQRSTYSIPVADVKKWHQDEYELFKIFNARPDIKVIDAKTAFCDPASCKTRVNGVLLYSDNNHLSDAGIALFWALVAKETGP